MEKHDNLGTANNEKTMLLFVLATGIGVFFLYRAFYLCYVAGKSEDRALVIAIALHRQRYGIISDYLGEAVKSRTEALSAVDQYLDHITQLGNLKQLCPEIRLAISVKLSQLGLLIDPALSGHSARRLFRWALRHGIEFEVDMEDRSTLTPMRSVVEELAAVSPCFRVAIAANFSESTELLSYFLRAGVERYRIVKGAYRGDIVKDPEIETNFLRLVKMVADSGKHVALATHKDELATRGRLIAPTAEVHMLFGVRPFARKHMVYMPWGNAWGRYFFRRLKEGIRARVLLLFLRNFFESLWWRWKFVSSSSRPA